MAPGTGLPVPFGTASTRAGSPPREDLNQRRARKMAETIEKPIGLTAKPTRPQEFYDNVKRKFAEERDLRLSYRPEGTAQYTSDLTGALSRYEVDPYASAVAPREPINDTVEVLFIGGGFSALLTSARLREHGVESIRIVGAVRMSAARGTGIDTPAWHAT